MLTAEKSCLELVGELSGVLARTLRMAAGDASLSLLADTPPVLTLQMLPWNRAIASEKERAALPSAFAKLALHSRALSATPAIKASFWEHVLTSEMADVSTSGVHECTLRFPLSPCYLIDFSGLEDFDEAGLAMLLAFMTTPIEGENQCHDRVKIAFGFSFANCYLTRGSLRLLERFLDRVFAHPERQYNIDLLDLSDNSMDADALAIVAQIVEKNAVVYQIKELKLNNIVGDETVDGSPLDKTPAEYLEILHAPLGVPRVRQACIGPVVQTLPPISKLRRITMKGNDLCSKPFAALGSALRYGCPAAMEELLSSFVVAETHSAEVKRECWRWLAFGLFYPRSRRFTGDRSRLRKLGPLDCSVEAMESMLRTLRNPVAEMLNLDGSDGVSFDKETSSGELMICAVKKGAKVQLIESTSLQGSLPSVLVQCDERTELEAFYEREDGSVYVVVPGAGLGWVERKDIERVERETIEQCCHAPVDETYAVKFVFVETEETQSMFRRFVRQIGRYLRGIDCSKCRFLDGTLQFILESCPHLEHLNLQACAFAKTDADALLKALQGDMGRRLLALNLNRLLIGDAFVQRLAAILSKAQDENAPVLQELRLHDTGVGEQALASLSSALSVNRTIHSLELKKSIEHDSDSAYLHLTQTFQGQVLRSAVPLACKLAFLSVTLVTDGGESVTSAQHKLDQWLVASILQFAATQERRQIFLNGTMCAPGRHS